MFLSLLHTHLTTKQTDQQQTDNCTPTEEEEGKEREIGLSLKSKAGRKEGLVSAG